MKEQLITEITRKMLPYLDLSLIHILEHTGLKVSSLYISQIKRKCGLDVGQNYNLSKKEDAKVPQCPPEKEAAIMDALKRFQMIM